MLSVSVSMLYIVNAAPWRPKPSRASLLFLITVSNSRPCLSALSNQ